MTSSAGTQSSAPFRVLLVEDDPLDAEIIGRSLARQAPRYSLVRVSRLLDAARQLAVEPADLVLLDLGLPDSAGLEGLERLRRVSPDVPVVVLTGRDDERTALAALAPGAEDYLTKQDLSGPALDRAIRYAIERHRSRRALESALQRVGDLERLVPFCAWCRKRVRNDRGEWQWLESYLEQQTGTQVTHGICPECEAKMQSAAGAGPPTPPAAGT